MKRLLFAIAGAAAFSAFATDVEAPLKRSGDISIVGFENYTPDQTVVGYGDSGTQGDNSLWSCEGDDASLVKTYAGSEVDVPSIKEPAPFAGETNTKYLALDTNGSELQRTVGATVAADGTYIDTLVQFTPSESAPNGTDIAGAKLAIWLGVENNVTNLMVQGNFWDFDQSPAPSSQAYALSGKTIEPGTWYRLTVKAIPNILGVDSGMSIPAFQISVDGTEMTLATAPLSAAFKTVLQESNMYASADMASAVSANKLVPAIQAYVGTYGDTVSLTSVGFKGTGALDDFVVTTEAPTFEPAAIDFTLTWPAGLTAVSYSIDGGAAVAISGASPLSIPNLVGGEAITFIVQNADGAQKTFSATAANGEGIDATGTTFGWAEYLGDAVSGAYQIDDFADLDMLRKGVAAGLATAGETFNQTANIDMSTAGPFAGIGTYNANLNNGVAFTGTYDGQGYTISNIDFTQRNYGGVFNQVKGGTIKNLTVDTITCNTLDKNVNAAEWGCAIVGNAGLGATLQNLVAQGSFGNSATPCSHNVAGIAVRVCGGASNVVDGVTMLETLVKDCTNNATLYGFYTKAAGITALTQDQNGVPNDYVLYDGCVNNANIAMVEVANSATTTNSTLSKIGRDGLGGIVGYVADGTKIKDCVNNGTLTSALTTAKIGGIVGWAQGRTLDDLGGNKNPAAAKMVGDPAGSTITGFTYATVDNGVATTTLTLAKDGEYLLEGNAAPVFAFAEAGTIAFDTALGYTLDGTGVTVAEGLELSSATSGTKTTYTAAVPAPPSVDIEPGQQDATVYPDAAAATAALENVTIVEPEDVSTNETISASDKLAYNALFEAKVVEVSGGYAIEVGLKAAAETALQTQADGDAAEIVDAINESTVTFAATPGLYYSIEHGTSLSLGSETEKVMATGSTLTLDMPAKPAGATSGFYKVKISVTK